MDAFGEDRRRAGMIGCLTAAAWTGQGLGSLLVDGPSSILDLTMIVPIMLTGVSLWLLAGLGWFGGGRVSWLIRGLAALTAATAIPCQIAFGYDVPATDPFAVICTAALLAGLVIAAVAALWFRAAPRWVGIALFLSQPAAIVAGIALSPISPVADHGDYTGAIGHGIVWALIGLSLLGKRLPFLTPATAAPAAAR